MRYQPSTGFYAGAFYKERPEAFIRRRVLLAVSSGAIAPRSILEAVGGRSSPVVNAREALVRSGLLWKHGAGKCRVYGLTPAGARRVAGVAA